MSLVAVAKENERISIEIVSEFIRIEIQETQRLSRYGKCTRHPLTLHKHRKYVDRYVGIEIWKY